MSRRSLIGFGILVLTLLVAVVVLTSLVVSGRAPATTPGKSSLKDLIRSDSSDQEAPAAAAAALMETYASTRKRQQEAGPLIDPDTLKPTAVRVCDSLLCMCVCVCVCWLHRVKLLHER